MRTSYTIAVAMLTGVAIGGLAVQALHAQAKPPAFYVGEIDVTDDAGYQRDFVPQSGASVQSTGGRFLARGGQTTTLLGEPVKKRVVIQQWDSMEQLKSWFDSAEQKKLRDVQAKYSKVRAYAVEGVPAK
jgi:uncharacterized protein (DUF1330 family)